MRGTFRLSCLALTVGLMLTAPGISRSQDTCDVLVTLNEDLPAPALAAYGARTTQRPADRSSGPALRLSAWRTRRNGNTIFDDDAGLFSNFVASLTDIGTGEPLISCVFALSAGFPCPRRPPSLWRMPSSPARSKRHRPCPESSAATRAQHHRHPTHAGLRGWFSGGRRVVRRRQSGGWRLLLLDLRGCRRRDGVHRRQRLHAQ